MFATEEEEEEEEEVDADGEEGGEEGDTTTEGETGTIWTPIRLDVTWCSK